MSYRVSTIQPFEREIKCSIRKYRSLPDEYGQLIESLADNPRQGTSLGSWL